MKLKKIGQGVSEEESFKGVDGRTDDGWGVIKVERLKF